MDRETKIRSTVQSHHLPDEIIEDILARLPVKSLLRFRCVSNLWRSLVGSERFTKSHLQNSTKNTDYSHHRVILNDHGPKQYSLLSLLNEPAADPSPFDYPVSFLSGSVRIVGSCNGLVCVFDQRGCFFVWNPATRIYKELPEIEKLEKVQSIITYGFGWDEWSDAYKVFVLVGIHNRRIGKVYCSKTNSWKTVKLGNFCDIYGMGQYVSGKFYWRRMAVNVAGIAIVSFDLKNEVFGKMKLPRDPMARQWVRLGVLGGCLSIVYYKKSVDVWVMKESWVKVNSLVNEPNEYSPFLAPIWIGVNGETLLSCGSSFFVCYPQENVLKEIKGRSLEAHFYVESLVSPVPCNNHWTMG